MTGSDEGLEDPKKRLCWLVNTQPGRDTHMSTGAEDETLVFSPTVITLWPTIVVHFMTVWFQQHLCHK